MKKAIAVILFVLVAASMIIACTRQTSQLYQRPSSGGSDEQVTLQQDADTDTYIDSQFIDPEEDIDIGEMI